MYRIRSVGVISVANTVTLIFASQLHRRNRPRGRVVMTTDMPVGASSARPIYPLPTSLNDAVLRRLAADDGATGRFVASGAGEAVLSAFGPCLDFRSGEPVAGACPLLRVVVGP
jgi:hypothetical protein